MGHAQTGANLRYKLRFPGAFRPETMIDRGGLNLPRKSLCHKQQQGQTIRPARYRHTKRAPLRPERGQAVCKTTDQMEG